MAQFSAPISPWPGVSDPISSPGSGEFESTTDAESHEVVFSRLVEEIASGNVELDVLLSRIALAAQSLTNGNGAALGMRRDGVVVCVGRSGETAPALGTKLSEDSGISGACLRTGQTLRCDDTETDLRVDAEVCRHLGLRAIAAAPIRSNFTTIGILEVFATAAFAFTDEHIAILSGLAELADIANSAPEHTARAAQTSAAESDLSTESSDLPDLPDPLPASIFWPPQESSPQKNRWRYMGIVGGLALAALLSAAGWKAWRDIQESRSVSPVTRPLLTTSEPPPQTLPFGYSEPPKKASAGKVSNPAGTNASKGLVPVSQVDDVLIRRIDNGPTASPLTPKAGAANQKPAAPVDSTVSEAPQVTMASNTDQVLSGLIPTTAAPPMLDIQISQGAAPLVLKKKVVPVYPKQALLSKVEGIVLVQATVNQKGRVEKMKLVSGPSILGKAAMDAVKLWQYEPAVLNGKPVPSETEITLKFVLP
jgi:TonB family protein